MKKQTTNNVKEITVVTFEYKIPKREILQSKKEIIAITKKNHSLFKHSEKHFLEDIITV